MSVLLMLGAGGHAQVIADAALESGAWSRVLWYDDDPSCQLPLSGDTLQGTIDSFFHEANVDGSAALGMGVGVLRQALMKRIVEAGVSTPRIVHPGACVSRFAEVGDATVVFAGAVINVGARVAHGVIINTAASVDHHCEIGPYAHICPGVHLAGNVRIGELAWIGIGASVIEGVSIGARAVIGAGAVVIDDVPPDSMAVGVPARVRPRTR